MRTIDFLKYGHLTILATSVAFGGMAVDPAYAQETGGSTEPFGDEPFGELGDGNEEEGPVEEEPVAEEEPIDEGAIEEQPTDRGLYKDNPNDDVSNRAFPNPYGIVPTRRVTPEATDAITNALRDAANFCSRIEDESYEVDCIGERIGVIAKSISSTGDYREARQILTETSTKLRRLAASNRTSAKPRIRASSTVNRQQYTTKPITPVAPARVKPVKQQAANILAEAETKLLRSAEASDRRLIAYAQMAKAVGSNKTLLRSA